LVLVGRLVGYLFPQIMRLALLKGLFLFYSCNWSMFPNKITSRLTVPLNDAFLIILFIISDLILI
jgi:hypothetical protein